MKKLLFLLLLLPVLSFGQEPESLVHNSELYVDDYADIFTKEQELSLDKRIREAISFMQISIVSIRSFGDIAPADYALRLGRAWGVGGKSNNGLIIIIGVEDRHIEAAVGYGLEGTITDLITVQFQRDYAVPKYKQKDYYGGTFDLLNAYIDYAKPEAVLLRKKEAEAQAAQSAKESAEFLDTMWNVVLFLAIAGAIAFIIYHIRKRREKRRLYIEGLKNEVHNAKNEIRRLVSLGKDAAAMNIEEGSQLTQAITESGLDPNLDIKSEQGYLNYIHAYTLIDKKTQSLEDKVTWKVRCIDAAAKFVSKMPDIKALGRQLDQEIELLSTLVLNKTDYSGSVTEYRKAIEQYSEEHAIINRHLEDFNIAGLQSSQCKIEGLIGTINSFSNAIVSKASDDRDRVHTARNARGIIAQNIEKLRSYCDKPGVTPAAKNTTVNKLAEVEMESRKFGTDLEANLILFSKLSDMLIGAEAAKKQHLEYEAEQARIREAEQKRIQAIKDKQEEEERQRRRRQEEEDDRRRRESYSSSFSSGFSSSGSSSSSSDFGGGSFGGGGGGSDW